MTKDKPAIDAARRGRARRQGAAEGTEFSLMRSSMSRHDRRKLPGIIRQAIAAPGDVHVGPQQDEIAAIDLARRGVGNVEHAQRRAKRGERLFQRRHVSRDWPSRNSVKPWSKPMRSCIAMPSSSQVCGSRTPGQVLGKYST